MAGNRLRFEEAIQIANDFVWAEKWQDAVVAYRRALNEDPNSESALLGQAWALLNDKQFAEALQVYVRLTKLIPTDPGPYERMGEILDHQGETQRAAEAYVEAAKRYGRQGLVAKRATALESSLHLQPHQAGLWSDLLEVYEIQEQPQKAVLAALWLAHLYQNSNRDRAITLCREVQRLAPHDARLGQTLILLQSNRPIPEPAPLGSEQEILLDQDLDIAPEGRSGELGTPVEIARQRALTKLAESIFAEDRTEEQGASHEIDLLIGRAVDAQTRGDVRTAIQYYERLRSMGTSMPSIHFNLGLLYKEQMQFDKAIVEFEASLTDPEYVLGSHFSLGECYQAQGNFREALKHFLEATKVVDVAMIERGHVDDLIRIYEGLTQSLVNTGESERAQEVSEMLVDFLGQRGWEDSASKARQRLDELARSGAVLSLAELISLPGSEQILRSIALAQEYERRRRPYSALEELFHTLSSTPDYLPLHHLLGVILRESGHLEEAIEKFQVVARAYEVRGQMPQALASYQSILETSPLDIPTHRRVIDLLVQYGHIDEGLRHCLDTADAYYQLAQPDRARETYTEALRLAPRGSPEKSWSLRILHRMADLDVQRLDWSAAIKDNEEILRIAPADERAHLALFRLYPRTGRPHLGIGALDNLIKHYISSQKVPKALAVLEDLVEEQPESIPLRGRIAQLYLNLGNREKALIHLDILGDLQLEAGHKEAAIRTIEAIIALNPANREDYLNLYREMAQREPPTRASHVT
jgi:tetratricopeptide (TPR) repeat protein